MVREVVVERVGLVSRNPRPDRPPCIPVDIGEGLDEALGVPGWEARRVPGRFGQVGVAAGQVLARRIGGQHVEVVGLLLAPDQPGAFAVDAEREAVLLARGHLAGVVHPARAAHEAHQDRRVVVHGAARHKRRDFGEDGLDVEPGHIVHEVVQVRPDVAHRRRRPCLRRILAPRRLLVAALLEAGREPSLRVLGHDLAHGAQATRTREVAGLLHHRVAGVVVRQREDQAGALDRAAEVLGVGHGGRHGLVADDVDAGVQEGDRDGVVKVVGGDDRHRVDAPVRVQGGLGPGHLAVGAVDAPSVQPQVASLRAGAIRVRRERPRDELPLPVQRRGHAVHGPDEGAGAAADHAIPELPAQVGVHAARAAATTAAPPGSRRACAPG